MKTSQTNWKAIDAMEDKDIDLSEDPEVSPEKFNTAIVRRNLKPATDDSEDIEAKSDHQNPTSYNQAY